MLKENDQEDTLFTIFQLTIQCLTNTDLDLSSYIQPKKQSI